MEHIEINTEFIKLGQLLKLATITTSGVEAKILILEGKVLVNGQTCLQRGKKVVKGDTVQVEGFEKIVVQ